MASIQINLINFAAQEGKATAIRAAEGLRDSLETLCEIGSESEKSRAGDLLRTVNEALALLVDNSPLIEAARQSQV